MVEGAASDFPVTVYRRGVAFGASRTVAAEVAVALTYGGSTEAVLMASPGDLEDFAVGFTLTEGIVDHPREIESVEEVGVEHGIEMRIALTELHAERLAARRRRMAGPVGCGLCGVESIEAALRPLPTVSAEARFEPAAILAAVAALQPLQRVNSATRSVHAAAFWRAGEGIALLREDIGRHNALDKLAGALARRGLDGREGAVLLTSRVSIEMVQKTAMIGAPLLVAVSAPSRLAIETAAAAGITLVAVARADGFEVFTHPRRIALPPTAGAVHYVA